MIVPLVYKNHCKKFTILLQQNKLSQLIVLTQLIFLGGLFESSEIEKEKVFSYAVEGLNNNLENKAHNKFAPSIKRVPQYDSFKVSQAGKLKKISVCFAIQG